MEDRFQHTIDGQEFNGTDLNTIATEASLADDHVFAELFRLGAGAKGVVAASPTSALVRPSGSADAKTVIESFRAFIGPLSATTGQDAYKNARSAVAASSVDLTPQTVQHPAQATNNRWDLIYARVDVDIDGPSILRFVKTGTTPAGQQSIVTLKQTTVTISVVSGSSAATPTKPALPSDSGSSHYIPLAYVNLKAGHTASSAIPPAQIDEVAPVLALSRATGAASLSVATGMYAEGGIVLSGETWPGNGTRPLSYMPPTMSGKVERVFALTESAVAHTIPLSGTGIIDSSIDWRKRMFKVLGVVSGNFPGGSDTLPWQSGGVKLTDGTKNYPTSSGTQVSLSFVGQSFQDVSGNAVVCSMTPTTTSSQMVAGSSVEVYVDLTTGNLMGRVGATEPNRQFFFWLEATGQFNNAF